MFTWKEIIDIAIQIENNGENIYRRAAQKIKDPDLSETLIQMADEEAKHAKWFSQLPLPDTIEVKNTNIDNMARVFIRDAMTDKALSLETTDFTVIENVQNLIHTSIGFEQDTILFYEMIGEFVVEESAFTLIETIIDEEKKHITTLEEWAQPDRTFALADF